MTENEIKEYIKDLRKKASLFEKSGYATAGISVTFNKSADTIENLLNELQQYRAIGTVEERRVAVERMKPKKPYLQDEDCLECPTCDSFIGYVEECKDEHYQDNYCSNCGQKLDWS